MGGSVEEREMSFDSHQIFLNSLHRSHLIVLLYTQHMRHNGVSVVLPPITEAERKEDAYKHSDDYDLILCYSKNVLKHRPFVRQVVNVKEARAEIFTDTHHPWPGLFVIGETDYVSAVERNAVPDIYIIVSKNLFDYAQIDPSTKDQWELIPHKDSAYGWARKSWRCPWDLVTFGTLNYGL